MIGHYYSQNIWYFDFCGGLSFSVLSPGSILPQKFTCIDFLWIIRNYKKCWTQCCEVLVVYGLKLYLMIYPLAAIWVTV